MATDVAERLNERRAHIAKFLQDVITEWSNDCQRKSDAEIAKSLRRLQRLDSDLHQAIENYIQAVRVDAAPGLKS